MVLSKKDKEFIAEIQFKYKKQLTNEQKKILARRIAKHFEDTYSNLRTVTIKVANAKKFFMKITKDPMFYLNIVPKREITKKVIEMNVKKLEHERDFRKIKKEFVDNIIDKFRLSQDIYELAIYILINTGRRINEVILNIDKFSNKPRDKDKIYFSGILKKRGDANKVEVITIDKKKDVLSAIGRFKKLLKKRSKESFQRTLQNKIKKLSPELSLTSHDLRSIYANYLFTFRNPENQIYNSFIRRVLHHKNLATSISYSDIKIID